MKRIAKYFHMRNYFLKVFHEEPLSKLSLEELKGGTTCTCNSQSSFSCSCYSTSSNCTCNEASSYCPSNAGLVCPQNDINANT